MKILCFGSLNLDHIYRVRDFVRSGETRSALSVETHCGGKGFNQAVAAARAGMDVALAGCIGTDGSIFVQKCAEEKIDASALHTVMLPTGSTIIQVNNAGENCILLYGGANRAVTRVQIDTVLDTLSEQDVLMLQNEINEMPYLTEQAELRGLRIALNPSPVDEQITSGVIARARWLFVNEVEAAQLCGEGDTAKWLERLSERCPQGDVILTLGSAGACCRTKDGGTYHQNAVPVQAVDTTAAGDTFTGYYLAAVLSGETPEKALKLAAKASALAVTRKGAFESIPRKVEIESESLTFGAKVF